VKGDCKKFWVREIKMACFCLDTSLDTKERKNTLDATAQNTVVKETTPLVIEAARSCGCSSYVIRKAYDTNNDNK
jgi:hypothetical protein